MAIPKKNTTATTTVTTSSSAPVDQKKQAKVSEPAAPAVPVAPVTPVAPVAPAAPAALTKTPAQKKKPVPTSSASDTTSTQQSSASAVAATASAASAAAAVATTSANATAVAQGTESSSDIAVDDKAGENLITSVVEKVSALSAQVKEIQTSLKLLVKEHEKQQKIIEKVQKKRENARKSPSGFAKPNKISDKLCDFIGVPHGTEKSRTEVTRFINAYVKEHNLNDPKNRRVILPDEKLKSILNAKEGEDITYFILQRVISHHFPLSISKMNANAATAATAATAASTVVAPVT